MNIEQELKKLKNKKIMIKAIAFDYGGVLKINTEDSLGELLNYLETTREDWDKEWFLGNKEANNSGKPYADYFLEVCSKFKNSEESKKHILDSLEKNKGKHIVNSELVEMIKKLKDNGYKIGLLSNYGVELRDKLKKDEIYDLFDAIVVSSEVGCQKPELEIFKILFTNLGVEPEEVVFIDDASKSLENAESIGYFPILYKNNESFKIELEKVLNITL